MAPFVFGTSMTPFSLPFCGVYSPTQHLTQSTSILCTQFIREDTNGLGATGGSALVAVGSDTGILKIVDAESDLTTGNYELAGGNAGGLSACTPIHRLSLLLVGSHRGGIYAVDLRAPEPVWTTNLPRAKGPISSMTLPSESDDPHALMCATLRGCLAAYDLRFRVPLGFTTVAGGPCCIYSMVACPSVSGSAAPSVVVSTTCSDMIKYDCGTFKDTMCLKPNTPNSARALLHLPRSQQIVSGGSDGIIRLWDLNSPEDSHTMACPPNKGLPYVYSRGGATIAEVMASDTQRQVAPHHRDHITAICVATARQQQYLVSAARDGSLKLWHNLPPVNTKK